MPKYVKVNDGLVEVPDSWTPQQIGSALKRAFPTAERKAMMDEMATARQGGTNLIAELPGVVTEAITPDTMPIPTYGTERPTEESYERLGKVDREAIQSPMVELPRVDVPDQAGFWNAFGREMVNQGISLPEFFTSPQGVATVALGAVPGGSTAVGAYYGSEMLHGAITEAQDAYANWGEMTPAEKGVSVARIVGSGAMMGGIMRHGMKRPSQLPRIAKEEGLAKDELTPEQGIRAMDAGDLPQIPRQNVIETPAPMLPNAAQTVSVIDTITKEQIEALKPKEAPEPSLEKPVSPVVEKPAPSEPAPVLEQPTTGVPDAIEARKVEEGVQPERAGVPQGQDIRQDVAQVRQGEGEQAGGGSGLRTAEEVQQVGAKEAQVIPQLLKHGSFRTDLTTLKPTKVGDFGSGVYLTTDETLARRFADSTAFGITEEQRSIRGSGKIYDVELVSQPKHPFVADDTPLTKAEKSWWEKTEDGLEEGIETRSDLMDAKTGRNYGAWERSELEFASEDWNEFCREFGFDAIVARDEILIKDPSLVRIKQISDNKVKAEQQVGAKAAEVAQTSPAAEVPKGAEPVGMGGAVASEFEQSSTRGIGVKISAIDQQRIARGEEPLAKLASRSFKGDVWPKTLAEIDVDPDAPSRLVEELRNKPRPLADADVAKLLYRQAELEYESANLSRQRAQAVEDAKRYPNRLEDVARIEGMEAVLNDQIDALERIAQPSKGETARGLAALRFMVKQNYTLAALEYRLRADSARDVGFLRGDALSESERATLKEIAEGYKKTSEAYEKRVAEVEQKFAESEAARIAAEAEAEAARELPRYSKQIIEYAERKVSEMEKTSERYVKELLSSTWAPGPEQIYKMGYIAATKMARGITELAKLTDEMVALLGERVRPYMEQIKAKAEEILEQETAKEQPQVRERIKRTKASGDVEADVLGRVKSAVAKDEMDALHPLVYKLSRLYAERGARGWRAITDRVHSALKPIIPGLDYRDTLDMVAGVGRFKPASKNEITVALGDARREAQKVAKIQRVISKQPVPKFGIGRPEPKAHERWLEKVFNEMRKLHGVVVTDPATQAKSALAAMKRAVQNQIADLEYEIGRRQRIVRRRADKPTDAELESLRARLAELREIEKIVFPKEPLTDAQRLERAIKAAKAMDDRIQKDVADAERGVFKEKRARVTSQELESIRAHAAASRARLAELEELAGLRLTNAERALLNWRRRKLESIAKYQDRIERGDFSVRTPKEPPADEVSLSIKAENEAWKNKFKELRVKEAYKRMAALKKLMHEFASFMINIKTLNSSFDLSAVGRQGGWLTSLHPWQAGKALGPMVRSMKNEKTALMYEQKLKQRKNYTNGKYQRSGLYLAPYDSYVMSKMEETYMATWAKRIPGVGMSQRAYVTFLNELRANTFDLLESRFRRFMGEPSDSNLKVLGNYINIVTGRGDLAKFNNAAESMAVLFWSPRLMVSRFQTLLMQPVWTTRAGFKEALAMRALVMAEYFQQIVTISAVALAAASAGADININPTSSDFLKINIGNGKSIDPFWGLQQPFVLLARIRAKKMTTGAGKEVPVDRKAPWGAAKLDDILLRYGRSKANPVWNILYNWWVEEDMFGAKYGNLEALRDVFVFLSWRDVLKLIADEGPIKGSALQALNLLGIPVQTKPSPEEQRLQNKMKRYEN